MKIELDKIPSLTSDEIYANFVKTHNIVNDSQGELYWKDTPLKWEKVKKGNKQFLLEYGAFRRAYVNALLAEVAHQVQCTRKCTALAVGSMNPTSDYDITVSGPASGKIVEKFNERFRAKWNKESGVVFDTNIYGTGFLHPNATPNFDFFIKTTNIKNASMITPNDFIYYVNLGNDPQDIRNQRIWALIKLAHWAKTNRLLISNMRLALSHQTVFLDDFQEATNKYLALTAHFPEQVVPLPPIQRRRSSTFQRITRTVRAPSLVELNREYEAELQTTAQLKRDFNEADGHDEVIRLGRALKDQISRTNFYGNETYFTQGAFNHVVGKLQSNFTNLTILPHEYVDSFFENFGEVIKEYSMYRETLDKDHFIIESSKYLIRCADALVHLVADYNLWRDSGEQKYFLKLYKQLLSISQQIRAFKGAGANWSEAKKKSIMNDFNKLLKITEDNSYDNIMSALVLHIFVPPVEAIYSAGAPFI